MMYTQELQSPALTLLLRTPNGRQGVGQNREKWIPNPEATSALELEMFAFLGKLMGIAIRSKEYLALSLPSIVWKLLAGDSPDQWDLEGVDFSLAKSLDLLRGIRCDEAQFAQTFFETFTTTSSADRTVELLPGGARRDVTYESRQQYCDLVTRVRYCSMERVLACCNPCHVTIPVTVPPARVRPSSGRHPERAGHHRSITPSGKRSLFGVA
jgi:hypothetical protein